MPLFDHLYLHINKYVSHLSPLITKKSIIKIKYTFMIKKKSINQILLNTYAYLLKRYYTS